MQPWEPASWCTLPKYLEVVRRAIDASESIESRSPKALPVVMVGNKSDCVDNGGQDEHQAARAWCCEHDVAYAEVSALTGDSASVVGILKTVLGRQPS
ncbi:unnamed protein product [Phytophthora fragariaefolia]|uniref:Unnamed protein product n=1 Tax=Phytophthora fragariaefolia TaxID=1490495 RepID=A0A9W6WU50_9STRA|nr:unnamed protein product [Phytophthora fragariaefolia]